MNINESLYYSNTKTQKRRYLENCRFEEPTREVIDMWFRQTAKIEAQEKCDLSQFNRPQVYDLLKGLNLKSKQTLRTIVAYFSDYYSWCIAEGLIDRNNIINQYDSKFSYSIIDEIITPEMVKGKFFKTDEVMRYIDLVKDPVNKFILYAIYMGVYGLEFEDLTNLKINDVDAPNKVVHLKSGKVQKIDQLFINLAQTADTQTLYAPDGILQEGRTKNNRYRSSEYIIKNCTTGSDNMPVSRIIIMSRLRLMQKQTGNLFLNGVNLYRNGMINYIINKFSIQDISFNDALLKKKNKLEYIYSDEMQEYINEFGSNMTVRMLRLQISEYIGYYD